MHTVAWVKNRLVNDHLTYLQDVLSGLNVKPQNYLVEDTTVAVDEWYDDRFDDVHIPFVVSVYYEGCIEEREWPGWGQHSFHRTLKGAQAEVAWLEYLGTNLNRIQIGEDAIVPKWELEYCKIQD